jgi:hypothetical protein
MRNRRPVSLDVTAPRRARRAPARGRGRRVVDAGHLETLDQVQHRPRLVVRSATLDSSREQRPRFGDVTAVTGFDTGMQQRLGFPDSFGDRRPRPVDVGPGPRVAAIQEQHPSPDVDGALEPSPKVVIETR